MPDNETNQEGPILILYCPDTAHMRLTVKKKTVDGNSESNFRFTYPNAHWI